jgi:hypothetical protein
MRLMSLQEFGETFWTEASRPSPATLRKSVPPAPPAVPDPDANYLPGRWVGGRFYVDADAWEAQDAAIEDPIVKAILNGTPAKRARARA